MMRENSSEKIFIVCSGLFTLLVIYAITAGCMEALI